MNRSFLTHKQALLSTLEHRKLRLTKARSQNFLIDRGIRQRIANHIPKAECIVEIGAGVGHFTVFLEEKTSRLLCIEIDAGFVPILREAFPHAQILHTDILDFSMEDCEVPIPENTVLVGNLPYHLSSKILEHILSFSSLPPSLHVMLEKDFVTEKLLAPSSVLGQQLSFFYQIQESISVSKECFFPRPRKDSRFLHMVRIRQKTTETQDYIPFLTFLAQNKKKSLKRVFSYMNAKEELLESYSSSLELRVHQIPKEILENLYWDLIQSDRDVFQRFRSPHEPW